MHTIHDYMLVYSVASLMFHVLSLIGKLVNGFPGHVGTLDLFLFFYFFFTSGALIQFPNP